MKLAIMQPYLFPYIGYFQLMNLVDRWVVFDNIQFVNKGWINRNRILHPDPQKGWQYITVPLEKKGRYDKICKIRIKPQSFWREKIFGKLTSYKKKAPYYKQTIEFLENCFDTEEDNLSKFVVRSLKLTADYLGIETKIDIQSDMSLPFDSISHSGQWALKISEVLGATDYINPHGGINIFNPSEFENSGICLKFLKPIIERYEQKRNEFVPGLSIIDIMMWNDINYISDMLKRGFNVLNSEEVGHE